MRPPIHLGEILAEELKAIGITPTALAHALDELGENCRSMPGQMSSY